MSLPSGLSNQLLEANAEVWREALTMRFVTEVSTDTIPDAAFARYRAFEGEFVSVASRLLGAAIFRSPTQEALQGHLLTLNSLAQEQFGFFEDAGGGTGALAGPHARSVADSLPSAVLRLAATATYAELVACMLPSEVLYAQWCAGAARTPSARPDIARWVQMHAEPPFTDRVQFLVAEVDSLVVTVGEWAHLADIVGQVLSLEIAFHDAAFIDR